MLKVTTARTSDSKGTSKVVAKCNGRQLTQTWDGEHSSEWNHGDTAGALLVKLGFSPDLAEVHADHTATDDGQRHTFTFAV
jgi:hypothetical protein